MSSEAEVLSKNKEPLHEHTRGITEPESSGSCNRGCDSGASCLK
jgi:hypothetical protein